MAIVGFFNTAVDPVAQLDAFNGQQCEYIYHDEASLLKNVQPGDAVVFQNLSAVGDDLESALGFIHRLLEHELDFVSVEDGLDSRSSEDLGRVVEAMYQLVQTQSKRRPHVRAAKVGEATPKAEGGRGRAAIPAEVIDQAIERYVQGDTVHSICEELGLSQGTLYRYVRERGVKRTKE